MYGKQNSLATWLEKQILILPKVDRPLNKTKWTKFTNVLYEPFLKFKKLNSLAEKQVFEAVELFVEKVVSDSTTDFQLCDWF